MGDLVGYLLAGVGGGAVVAALAVGLVLCFRTSGTVNFAYGAIGMYLAYVFLELRRTGELLLPVVALPARLPLVARPTVATALIVMVLVGALLGAALYWCVFRPLRNAPALGRVVASLGVFIYLQDATRRSNAVIAKAREDAAARNNPDRQKYVKKHSDNGYKTMVNVATMAASQASAQTAETMKRAAPTLFDHFPPMPQGVAPEWNVTGRTSLPD
jgi:branched-subunit amino acid ABC-type transport system permease component